MRPYRLITNGFTASSSGQIVPDREERVKPLKQSLDRFLHRLEPNGARGYPPNADRGGEHRGSSHWVSCRSWSASTLTCGRRSCQTLLGRTGATSGGKMPC